MLVRVLFAYGGLFALLSVKDEVGVVRAKTPLSDDEFWFERSRDYLGRLDTDRHSAMDLARAMDGMLTYFHFFIVQGPNGDLVPDEEFDAEYDRSLERYGPPVTEYVFPTN